MPPVRPLPVRLRRRLAESYFRVKAAPPVISRHWRSGPPDWVGVGVQRAGTSWWHSMVEAHLDVHALGWAAKELHYFDRFGPGRLTSDEVAAYRRNFLRPSTKQCGEWTPRYMFDPWTPAHLHQAAPDARLLVMLRDPMARFESGLSHEIGLAGPVEAGPSSAAWAGAFERGLYHQQLQRVLEHFDRDQVLVLQFERCIETPEAMLDRTFEFLGLDPERIPRHLVRPAANRRRGPPIDLPPSQRAQLRDGYESDVRLLVGAFPEIDLQGWPNFRHLA